MTRVTTDDPVTPREGPEPRREPRKLFRIWTIVSILGFFALLALSVFTLLTGRVTGAAGAGAVVLMATLFFSAVIWFIRHQRSVGRGRGTRS